MAQRREALQRLRRVTFKDAAAEIMEEAYLKASARDTLPANARQIMYAARGHIQERTGKQLKDTYFTQTLLPDYISERTARRGRKVDYDDRGHFREPHTGREIGLGTAAVRSYLGRTAEREVRDALETRSRTFGPASRYVGVLFVEKEGFDALFEAVQMAERYDLAFMSTKGISVTAARELAERLCSTHQIPLFVLRDFDKAGFTGAATFQRSNRRYTYKRQFEVVDLGLRLEDVRDA